MSTSVLIPIAPGCEEMEAVILIDTFRRAGWNVVAAAVDDPVVVCSRGVRLVADAQWDQIDANAFDLLVLPGGGPGTERLCGDESVLQAIRSFVEAGKWVGAVCAAPLVLQQAGVVNGVELTSHPSVGARLTTARYRSELPVVIDRRFVTSQGPGTSFEFALTLVGLRDGEDRADELRLSMCLPRRIPAAD